MDKNYSPYHLVEPSPWPYIGACGAFFTTTGFILFFHYNRGGVLFIGLMTLVFTMAVWWRDVIRESTFQGHHTLIVKQGLKYGMILFIVSEVCLFFSFFWAFFHSSLNATVEIGAVWPPQGTYPLNFFSIPLLNTAILLSSGVTVTVAHFALISGNRQLTVVGLLVTVVLGLIFTVFQGVEYFAAPFAISDSIYGATFFLTTGAHGAHVLIGSIFLLVCLFRAINYQFIKEEAIGFELAAWYWHFVDVVWLFLFIFMYWWGS
uniref:Cytochrome c oxidase subunit 3 n=1 Tax=Igernella notabilis TaxID=479643 RepID=I6LIR5_9METZ|nr:cytochrome c oxidase subunit III [Igernella notabilis]ABW83946.1 cytochrome c oxidase subunit 3 [Igernella notabilis]